MAVVCGFPLAGAVFNGGVLAEATSTTSELVPLPNVYVAWVPNSAPPPYPVDSVYSSPVYFSLERETLLTQVSIPVRRGAHQWILAGAAVFLGTD